MTYWYFAVNVKLIELIQIRFPAATGVTYDINIFDREKKKVETKN